jgi:hypothetical protein
MESIIEHVRALNSFAIKSSISTDPSHYIIDHSNYRRFNSIENDFRMRYLLPLLRAFHCRCAVCGSDSEGYELDHFFLPKSKGGNLILTHQDGYRLFNAAPLCISCNRRKYANPASSIDISVASYLAVVDTTWSLSASLLGTKCLPHPTPLTRLRADDAVAEVLARWPVGGEEWRECEAYLRGLPNRFQEVVDRLVGWVEEGSLLSSGG